MNNFCFVIRVVNHDYKKYDESEYVKVNEMR